MGLVVAPIKEGNLEAWKSWSDKLTGSKKSEFKEFNKRYGLTRHDVWLVESPNGETAVVLHEGPDSDSFMQKLGQTSHNFDLWFKESIEDFHDMRLDQPPPGPPPKKMV